VDDTEPTVAGPGALNIADAKRFQLDDVMRIGPDVRLTATPPIHPQIWAAILRS
jgi:riboflavin biosynthesis pyrimidine reductase